MRICGRFVFQFFVFVSLLLPLSATYAVLDMELTRGMDRAIPIAVIPFAWDNLNGRPPIELTDVISADLRNSGAFAITDHKAGQPKPSNVERVDYQYWRDQHVDDVVIGRIKPLSRGRFQVEYSLIDLYKGQQQVTPGAKGQSNSPVLLQQQFVVERSQLRRLAHHIADEIYQQLTGEPGVFSTRLAYVLVQQPFGQAPKYTLQIADMDGHSAQAILRSDEPIMSPSWSPDGTKIAYVSFEEKRPKIFISDVATGKRRLVTSYPGINGAPAWSPDGKSLALALSKNGSPDIFVMDLKKNKLRRMTNDAAINTEPSWSPDGKSIIFTSDRGGAPQIYKMDARTARAKRLSFDGPYNASASYTPDGKNLVLLHRGQDRIYNIAVLNLSTGILSELTRSGMNESPSVAPNGKMVVYASQYAGRGVLGMVSIDGKVRLRLPDQRGNVQEPVWSPFLYGVSG